MNWSDQVKSGVEASRTDWGIPAVPVEEHSLLKLGAQPDPLPSFEGSGEIVDASECPMVDSSC